jgi:hypothetical protein
MSITATATLGGGVTATATLGATITAGGDATPPTFTASPASASVDDTSFNITATLNEWGSVYSLVQAAAAAAPSIATVISTGESAIDTGSGVTIAHTGLTASTNYTAYVVAVDDDSNQQAALTDVDVTTDTGYDTDAEAFFTAASITDTTEKNALNQFVIDLKGTGSTPNSTDIWTKLHYLCPVSPTSQAAALYDLKLAYNGTAINGGMTHATTGVKGVNTKYTDRNFNPYTEADKNDFCFFFYNRAAITNVYNSMGNSNGNSNYSASTVFGGNVHYDIAGTGASAKYVAASIPAGLSIVNRTASNAVAHYNENTLLDSSTEVSTAFADNNFFEGCRNSSGSPTGYAVNQEYGLFGAAQSLTANEIEDLTDANTRYQTNVISGGREI